MAVDLKFILGIIGNIIFFFFLSTLLCLIYLFLMQICLLRCFFCFATISFLATGGRYDNMRSAGSMDPLIAYMRGRLVQNSFRAERTRICIVFLFVSVMRR
jgi:hypothetical protein